MKSLISYSRQSGNTLKLAKAIQDNINGERDIYPGSRMLTMPLGIRTPRI